MNRQLSCTIVQGMDTAVLLAAELVQYGFIHPEDSQVGANHRPAKLRLAILRKSA